MDIPFYAADVGDSVFRPTNAGLIVLGRAPMAWYPMAEIVEFVIYELESFSLMSFILLSPVSISIRCA